MKVKDKKIVKFSKELNSYIGYLPEDGKDTTLTQLLFLIFTSLFFFSTFLGAMVWDLIHQLNEDTQLFFENLLLAATIARITVQRFILIIKRKEFDGISKIMNKIDQKFVGDPDGFKILESYDNLTLWIFKTCCRLYILTIILFEITPFFSDFETIPYSGRYGVDYHKHRHYFWIILAYQTIASLMIMCATVLGDIGGGSHMLLIRSYLKTLSSRIKRMRKGVVDGTTQTEIADKRELYFILEVYNDILMLFEAVEDAYGLMISNQFIVSVVSSCLSVYFISSYDINVVVLFKMLSFITSILSMPFTSCLCGQLMLNSSEMISVDLFYTDWYNKSATYQANVKYIMERIRNPIMFHIGKIIDVKLETFLTIIQTTYTLYTVIQSRS